MIESHKTIRELHFTIEHLERKIGIKSKLKHKKIKKKIPINIFFVLKRKQRSNLEQLKIESDESLKLTLEKCAIYCEKINQYVAETSDEDSACPNDREFHENKEEMIIKTLQNVIKEKKEIKV